MNPQPQFLDRSSGRLVICPEIRGVKKLCDLCQGALAITHNYIDRIFMYRIRSGSMAMNRLTSTTASRPQLRST
jgi:hypothetical protein